MNKLNTIYSQNPLDRMDPLRADKSRFDALLHQDETLFLCFSNHDLLTFEGQAFIRYATLKSLNVDFSGAILLGQYEGRGYFTLNLHSQLGEDHAFTVENLRDYSESGKIKDEMMGVVAQAASVTKWHLSHTHCANCGAPTKIAHSGWRRDCGECKVEHFPRTDPVVIMLVTHGDQCLLGRSHHYNSNRYSCLAGFVENGETIEAAARRELHEEAGIVGGEVSYITSQPWPFPSNLMFGMHVRATSYDINIDPNEIEDAMWVDRKDVKAVLDGTSDAFELPPKLAIARTLLQYWIDENPK